MACLQLRLSGLCLFGIFVAGVVMIVVAVALVAALTTAAVKAAVASTKRRNSSITTGLSSPQTTNQRPQNSKETTVVGTLVGMRQQMESEDVGNYSAPPSFRDGLSDSNEDGDIEAPIIQDVVLVEDITIGPPSEVRQQALLEKLREELETDPQIVIAPFKFSTRYSGDPPRYSTIIHDIAGSQVAGGLAERSLDKAPIGNDKSESTNGTSANYSYPSYPSEEKSVAMDWDHMFQGTDTRKRYNSEVEVIKATMELGSELFKTALYDAILASGAFHPRYNMRTGRPEYLKGIEWWPKVEDVDQPGKERGGSKLRGCSVNQALDPAEIRPEVVPLEEMVRMSRTTREPRILPTHVELLVECQDADFPAPHDLHNPDENDFTVTSLDERMDNLRRIYGGPRAKSPRASRHTREHVIYIPDDDSTLSTNDTRTTKRATRQT